jgi:hypothetical protein
MGIENLEKVIGFGLAVGAALIDASGKTSSIGRAASLLHLVEDLPALFTINLSALKDEVKDLNPAELDELKAYINANFSVPDSEMELQIEGAISVVIDLAKVGENAVALWKAKSNVVPLVAPPAPEAPAAPVDPVPPPTAA